MIPAATISVAADGRFLLNTNLDDAMAPPIAIVQNWEAALTRR